MNKTNAMRRLEKEGIPFQAHEYSTDDGKIDAVSVAEKIRLSADQCFKTLVTQAADHNYYVFVIPGPAELDLKKAARVTDRKSIRLIPLKELLPLTGYVHGGCSPIGMKKEFPTFIDETAILFDEIGVSGGQVGLNLTLNPERLAGLIGATFADLTAGTDNCG